MKYTVAALEGALLDAAVAKAEGATILPGSIQWPRPQSILGMEQPLPFAAFGRYAPSSEWADGGPIIERERIATWRYGEGGNLGCWTANVGAVHGWDDGGICPSELPYDRAVMTGETPLLAAMRAYVASKLGEEIEL